MTNSPRHDQSGLLLRTLGQTALEGAEPANGKPVRKKDLALLIFLCVEGPRAHSRPFLSSLLWGDHSGGRARHSLTQAVGRLRRLLGDETLISRTEQIEWRGPLACDACTLEHVCTRGDGIFSYGGDFLKNFRPGAGAQEFESWAEHRRTRYRAMALQILETWGVEAEAGASWSEALELGQRTVEIEALYEEGHRRIMRAWAALGDRGLALRHYGEFAVWLHSEVGLDPDPATARLASELRSEAGAEPAEDRGGTAVGGTVAEAAGGRVGAVRARDRPIAWSAGNGVNGSMWTRLMRALHRHASKWGLERLDRRFHLGREAELSQATRLERRP